MPVGMDLKIQIKAKQHCVSEKLLFTDPKRTDNFYISEHNFVRTNGKCNPLSWQAVA